MNPTTPALHHVALLVPNLPEVVERLKSAFGMVVEMNAGRFALGGFPPVGLPAHHVLVRLVAGIIGWITIDPSVHHESVKGKPPIVG